MKSWLQDLAITIALWLALSWLGWDHNGWQWLVIMVAMIAMALRWGNVAYRNGVAYGMKHHAMLSPEDFDKWLRSHGIDPSEAAKHARD